MTGLFWMLAVPSMVVAGCSASSHQRATEGSGHIVIEQRPLADFQRVDLQGEGRLIMGPDEPASLEVRTNNNLMPLIESEVIDGTLIIGTRPHTALARRTASPTGSPASRCQSCSSAARERSRSRPVRSVI